VAIYLGLSLVPYWHFWLAGGTRFAGKGGDPAASAWFLEWVPYAIRHGHNPFITNWANYPFGINGFSNTSMALLGVLAIPVTLISGACTAVTLLFTLAFPLSALAAYTLIRRWTRWRPAAFAGGLLYGFSPYMAGQGGGHLNLVFVPLPPIIFLVLYEIAARRHGNAWLWGSLLGLLCVAQFFISSEILASTVVIGAIGLIGAAALSPHAARMRSRFVARAAASAAVLAGALLAYPVWLMVRGPARITGPAQLTQLYRADLLAPVIPDSSLYFTTRSLSRVADGFSGNPSDNGSYLGIPLLALVLIGAIVLWRQPMTRPIIRVVSVSAVAASILSLGSRLVVHGHVLGSLPLPGSVFSRLPLLDNTIAARYSLYVVLGAAVVLALVLDQIHARLARGRGWRPFPAAGACAILTGLVLAPLIPAWPYAASVTQVPAYFTARGVDAIPAGSVAVLYPFPCSGNAVPMLWQVAAGMRFKTPGGRFIVPTPGAAGPPPADRQTLTGTVLVALEDGSPPPLTPALHAALTAELRSWHVRSVLMQSAAPSARLAGHFFEWLLGRPPDARSGGIEAWYGSPR